MPKSKIEIFLTTPDLISHIKRLRRKRIQFRNAFRPRRERLEKSRFKSRESFFPGDHSTHLMEEKEKKCGGTRKLRHCSTREKSGLKGKRGEGGGMRAWLHFPNSKKPRIYGSFRATVKTAVEAKSREYTWETNWHEYITFLQVKYFGPKGFVQNI